MQQKFIFLISAIIVGVAVFAGLKISNENLREANQNGVMLDALIITGRAQAWYRTPVQLGGGGGSFLRLTFAAINFDSINANGIYLLSDLRKDSFAVTGTGTEGSPLKVTLQVFPDSIAFTQVLP
jgi:hypothetical protein